MMVGILRLPSQVGSRPEVERMHASHEVAKNHRGLLHVLRVVPRADVVVFVVLVDV